MLRMPSQCTRSGERVFSLRFAFSATDRCKASLLSPPHAKKTELLGSAFSLYGAVTRHLTCEACYACCHNTRDRVSLTTSSLSKHDFRVLQNDRGREVERAHANGLIRFEKDNLSVLPFEIEQSTADR